MLLERYINEYGWSITNEKYSLQEYEGKVRDAILDEINVLNKNAILISLFIYKFKMFMTTRVIKDKDLNCSLILIYYDRDSGRPNKNKADDGFIGPDMVDGATAGERVFVYVPISLNTAPFAVEYMNEYCHNDNYRGCSKNLKLFDCTVNVNNYDSIAPIIKQLREKYDANVESFIDGLPEECRRAKKTMNINTSYVLKTVKHEFTHVLDQPTASRVNHFTGLGIDNVDEEGLELALNILYMLWSRTEFNAFTQTFGKEVERPREIVKSNYINKVSLDYLSRPCADGDTVDLDEAIDDINKNLEILSDPAYDEEFWDVIRNIVIDGCVDNSERYENMSPMKFRNYFIKTTNKLIEKFKNKLTKNIASQNTYEHDVSNIASEIRDAANKAIENYEVGDVVELDFNFDHYFKKIDQSCKVYVNTETAYSERDRLNDNSISSNSLIHITIGYLNIVYDVTPIELFGTASSSFVELYKEIITKKRKTMINKWCINFAEDLLNVLNRLITKK